MVVIRLSRAGAKKRPFYHICVSDRRNKRDGSFIEKLGFYNPIAKETEEKIKFDKERYDYWVSVGAQPSDTVMMLLKRSQICLLYTSPSPRDLSTSRMPSSA